MRPDLAPSLKKLSQKQSLDSVEMQSWMRAIMTGELSDGEIADFLRKLREKGEVIEEVVAAASVMRGHGVRLGRSYPEALDTCGTGGDARSTLNVSTLAALIAAAAGVKVCKHGNRSVSSHCGSADILELLGVTVDLPGEAVEAMIEATGFGFLFAPRFHPATRYAMAARKSLGGKTLFNLLGPLSNPAGAGYQLVGVYDKRFLEIMATALMKLGVRRALVVHGSDGSDEITLCGPTYVAETAEKKVTVYQIEPKDAGFEVCELAKLQCRDREESRSDAVEVLAGRLRGPKRDVVVLNAGAGLLAAGAASTIREGAEKAAVLLDSGLVMAKLDQIIAFSKKVAAGGAGA